MKSKQAEKLINDIDKAKKDIESFQVASESEKSYLAKFLIVYICGIYEEVIETIINERASKCNDKEISHFIEELVDRSFRNPDMGNIKGLLGKFDDGWKLEVGKLPHDAQTAIDNIVNNKNSLAHGNEITLTLEDTMKYYTDSMVVINKIDDMLL